MVEVAKRIDAHFSRDGEDVGLDSMLELIAPPGMPHDVVRRVLRELIECHVQDAYLSYVDESDDTNGEIVLADSVLTVKDWLIYQPEPRITDGRFSVKELAERHGVNHNNLAARLKRHRRDTITLPSAMRDWWELETESRTDVRYFYNESDEIMRHIDELRV